MISIETAGTIVSQWGEAPLWWQDHLLYVDIHAGKIHRYHPDTGREETWQTGSEIGTVVPREGGGLLAAGAAGIFFVNDSDGTITPIAHPEADRPDNRFNDGKCSPDGRFFVGRLHRRRKTGEARLYRLDPDLSLREVFGPVTTSNGIVWSPDGHTVHYIDTPRREVLAFDYQDGHLHSVRTAFSTAHIDASPDGMTVDAEGRLWIAFCHGGCVACFDPASGSELERIELPCVETTACAFGGPGLADLYVTTGIHPERQEQDAGRLFLIRGLPTRGLPSHGFAG